MAQSSVVMGDDTPLAFAIPTPSMDTTPETTVTPMTNSMTGIVPPAPVPMAPKPKGTSKVMMVVLGIFALLGVLGAGGFYAYQQFGAPQETVVAVITQKDACKGCQNGKKLHWNGVKNACVEGDPCKVTGNEGTQENCKDKGGFWCGEIVDTKGKSHSFCGKNDGRACYKQAIDDQGITVSIGAIDIRCEKVNPTCENNCEYAVAEDQQHFYTPYDGAIDKANKLCTDGVGTVNFGNGKFLCKEGVKGYTGSGACTANNGVAYNGNLGCFCGTVQVDTGNGHQSYSSTCGCNKKTPPPSAPPVVPEMACTGITKTPDTTPVIGTVLTFTCTGSVTPTTAGTLTYKFRVSKDSAAATALANTTATTAKLTIVACGTYKVQCQACTTLNGVLTCDPLWVGATQ